MSSASASPSNSSANVASVPLLDVQRQYQELREQFMAAIGRVCDSGRFVLGPDCEELEKSSGRYCHSEHAVACASGSDALLLALMALDIGPGDEVMLPSYTFFATASAVVAARRQAGVCRHRSRHVQPRPAAHRAA